MSPRLRRRPGCTGDWRAKPPLSPGGIPRPPSPPQGFGFSLPEFLNFRLFGRIILVVNKKFRLDLIGPSTQGVRLGGFRAFGFQFGTGSQDSARTPPRRNSRSSRPPRSSTVSWASFSARQGVTAPTLKTAIFSCPLPHLHTRTCSPVARRN